MTFLCVLAVIGTAFGFGAISRMEYLNAADMKKMTDKRGICRRRK